eukprot:12793385-Alexandrium_andersonii.AAC.1
MGKIQSALLEFIFSSRLWAQNGAQPRTGEADERPRSRTKAWQPAAINPFKRFSGARPRVGFGRPWLVKQQ